MVSREENVASCGILGLGHSPQVILTGALSAETVPVNGEGD